LNQTIGLWYPPAISPRAIDVQDVEAISGEVMMNVSGTAVGVRLTYRSGFNNGLAGAPDDPFDTWIYFDAGVGLDGACVGTPLMKVPMATRQGVIDALNQLHYPEEPVGFGVHLVQSRRRVTETMCSSYSNYMVAAPEVIASIPTFVPPFAVVIR
jgi:hypothetical protein